MKILMLFQYGPLPPPLDLGGTKRNLPFLLELAKRHEVSVLSYGTPEEEGMFRGSYGHLFKNIRFVNCKRPRIVNGLGKMLLLARGRSTFRELYRPAMQRAIYEMAEAQRYDLVHCCTQKFGYFDFPAGVPVTSDTHNVEYRLLQRSCATTRSPFWKAFFYLAYRFGKREEIALCRKFDLLIATTEVDLGLFRKDLPDLPMTVIQNGAGATFFEDLKIQPEPGAMVFTGLFSHRPNTDGILYFLDKIFPLILRDVPGAKLFVVGKAPPKELLARASSQVVVTGFVDDVRPYMARAEVYIIPLLAGGGIRGKALEAMAMRRPIVTTTVGVEGIHLQADVSALFADEPEVFAGAVLRLLREPGLRQRLAQAAFKTAVEEYNWEAKGRELDRALGAVVAKRARGDLNVSSPIASGGSLINSA